MTGDHDYSYSSVKILLRLTRFILMWFALLAYRPGYCAPGNRLPIYVPQIGVRLLVHGLRVFGFRQFLFGGDRKAEKTFLLCVLFGRFS